MISIYMYIWYVLCARAGVYACVYVFMCVFYTLICVGVFLSFSFVCIIIIPSFFYFLFLPLHFLFTITRIRDNDAITWFFFSLSKGPLTLQIFVICFKFSPLFICFLFQFCCSFTYRIFGFTCLQFSFLIYLATFCSCYKSMRVMKWRKIRRIFSVFVPE